MHIGVISRSFGTSGAGARRLQRGLLPSAEVGSILVALGWTSPPGAALVFGCVRERIFLSAGDGSSETLQGVEASMAS